jgi:predicted PhzF superfamily epimerase YddE/YHI9
MELRSFQADAFTDEVFKGNPAAVVILPEPVSDNLMLRIASENNLPESAFLLSEGNGYRLRWFTPDIEMDLCGHATLASAHILFSELGFSGSTVTFYTCSGDLTVTKESSDEINLYSLNFPVRKALPSTLPPEISGSISLMPREVYKSRDYLLVYDKESDVAGINFDRMIVDKLNLGTGGIIVTAKGEECDFVSRFFTPGATLFEDPVTGSAHCTLAPYWSEKLQKDSLFAKQISARRGKLFCSMNGDRVIIKGAAVTYSKSIINI